MSFPFSAEQVLSWVGGRLANSEDFSGNWQTIRVSRPAPLGESTESDLAFFFSRDFEAELATAQPGILVTGENFVQGLKNSFISSQTDQGETKGQPGRNLWKTSAIIACRDPYLAMALLSEKFAQFLSGVAHISSIESAAEIHPTAVVSPSARLGVGVKIGPHCVIEEGVQIGDFSVLYSGCYLGSKVVLGKDCVLFPRVTLYEWTQVGDRARFHSGCVLGSDGFGYAPRRQDEGKDGGASKPQISLQKIYHLGRVVVGDDVEIGANSCVDRGTFGLTLIENGAKLDNLVHIGHNSRVGEGSVICGGTCLAGNASTGKFATIGGLTGVANQVHIGDGAKVGALSLVTKDVAPGATAVGNPQREYQEHFRAHALLNRLLSERRKK